MSAIDVEVLTERAPPNDSPPLFQSGGGAWYMQPEGSGYRLNFQRSDGGPLHTVACSDAGTTQVQVYIDQEATPRETARSGATPSKQVRPETVHSRSTLEGPVNPMTYPLDQLLLMNHLSARGGVIVHGAGAVVGGGALVFPGVSGAGKSTLSRLFVDAGLGDSLLSDDRVILRRSPAQAALTGHARAGVSSDTVEGESVIAWGTPWAGDAQVARNAEAPLTALLFLVKADANELTRLDAAEAMRRLMPVVSCPWYDAKRLPDVLETSARVVESILCYDLHFRPDEEVIGLLCGRSWVEESEQV
jgi:hypothetical protein